MKILVTGGAGFIGSHVVDLYLKSGHAVSVVDNLTTGVKENLNPRAKFFNLDLRSPEFAKLVGREKPEVINHHAAHIHVGRSVENPAFDADVNILGTLNLLQSAAAAGSVKKLIFASTGGAIYGDKPTPFDESMPVQPVSPYGISKRAAELYLFFYFHQYGIRYLALRYANVYGPRQNPYGEAGVISIFCDNLLTGKPPLINGDGRQTRDYVYVADIAKANLLALTSDKVGEFNLGTGVETDVNRIYTLVAQAFPSAVKAGHGPTRPGEQQTSSLNFAKAQAELGWRPETVLTDGIKKTVAFFKDEAPSTLRSGYLPSALRRERNPSEAKLSSLSATGSRPGYLAKGDK